MVSADERVVAEVQWVLVVPVKRLELAKTRLGPPYDRHRRDLALAFALDTTAAALACRLVEAVVVVTDEPDAATALRDIGAETVADEPAAGLNPALSHGVNAAARRHPGRGAGALSADVPALRPDELTLVLERAVAHPSSFLRDAEGTGTTLVLGRTPGDLRPSFGHDSARRHLHAGLVEVDGEDVASVRRDVDTADDLQVARSLGVGPHTAALLADIDPAGLG